MAKLRSPFLVALAASLVFAACGTSSIDPARPDSGSGSGSGSGSSSSGGSASSSSGVSGSSGGADCGAIESFPAILTVVSSTGAPLACDAVFWLESPTDDGPGAPVTASLCNASAPLAGCPASPADAGGVPCVYALDLGALGTTSDQIMVSQPGYPSTFVTGVNEGEGGCVPYVAPSTTTVTLQPIVDAAVDDG